MSTNDALRQSLMELHYDLLEDDEAARLRQAIATDPEVAAEWAATLRLAGQLADAAKIEATKLPPLTVATLTAAQASTEKPETSQPESSPSEPSDQSSLVHAAPSQNGRVVRDTEDSSQPIMAELVEPGPSKPCPSESTTSGERDPATRLGASSDAAPVRPVTRGLSRPWWIRSAVVAATAAAIGFVVIGSWYLDRAPIAPAAVVRLQAQPVPEPEATADNEYRFVTSRLDGSSTAGMAVTPASLSFSVLARGSVLFSGTTQTGSDGSGRVVLPRDLAIPEDAKLKVTARSSDARVKGSTIEVPLEPTRCITFVTVDRPVYRPGETVFFRSLTLSRRSLSAGVDVPIRFELIDPSGAVVPGAFIEGVTDRGVGNGSFHLPSAAPGGPYTLVAKSLDDFFPEERREFQVRAYRVPRFKKELDFRRRSYGPGETVEADFSAQRAEGGVLADTNIRITATVDDKVVHQQSTTTSPLGSCLISFDLPEHISEGTGTLSVMIDDGGTQETQSKSIPIQLGRVEVDFYPEGGYLVDGLKNRVYFAARDFLGEPVHLRGEVLSRSGQSVATIETVRDGMGRFEFTPQRGERYTLKVIEPVDVTNIPRLPAVVKDLPVIDTAAGVFERGKPIAVTVRSKSRRTVIVRAVCRGQLVGEKTLKLRIGDNRLSLPVRDDTGGVVRVTVLDTATVPASPLVERLVYRRHDKQLHVDLVEQGSELEQSPGKQLRLTLQVRDESGRPTPAVLGVSVVDDAALSLDETERPTLRTHFLLTSEVRKPEDLEHANFYLSDDPEAGQSLDLLLGTQGWRRFVSGTSSSTNVDFREQLIRLLELDGEDQIASAGTSFDNSQSFQQQWQQYRAAAAVAWDELILQAQLLLLAVLLIWLGAVMVRMRQYSATTAAGWLLIASSSLAIYGCGASQESMVAATEEDAAPSRNSSARQEARDMGDMAPDAEKMVVESPSQAMGNSAEEAPAEAMPTAPPMATAPPADPAQMDPFGKDSPNAGFAPSESSSVARAAQDALGFDDDDNGNKYHSLSNRSNSKNVSRLISSEDLKRLLTMRGLDAEALADQLLDELRFPVRQYAHRHKKSNSEVREDFAETLYWQPMLITDSSGKATIRFDLSDSVTTFRVHVDGHSADGRLGSGGGAITSRLPFQIEPKLPLEVTTGDRIDLPIAVINATDEPLGVELELATDAAIEPIDEVTRMLSLSGEQRQREHVSLKVVEGSAETDAMIEIRGVAGGSLSDTVRRPIHVSPAGYPARESLAGVLNQRAKIQLPIPRDMVDGSLAVTIRAYPSPLADVMSGIESILREPHGCFEQTSATNYPNTMALLYLQENDIANPDVSRRAHGMLDRGYQKLTSFECEKRGYEWFGKDPGHEALSAFGLMQFSDMARVMKVSDDMVTRTRKWLMGRRNGEGGFHRNPRHLHVWSVKQPIVNAYVLWAITEADVAAGHPQRAAGELAAELDELARVAQQSDDAYLIALSAAALLNVKRTEDGEALLDTLVTLQAEDGGLEGKTTVTSSGGISLKVETTAIATLAWLKSPRFIPRAKMAAKWITANRRGNAGFGSTQATVLALKALVAVSQHARGQQGGGELQVLLHGEVIGSAALPAEPKNGSTVEIKGLGTQLQDAQPGVEIELVAAGVSHLSYTIDVAFHAITPKSDDACPIRLSTEMKEAATAGDTFDVSTRVENVSESGQPMTVAIVGLPGGVEPKVEQLDELQDAGKFDYYELRGREVIFYWRTMPPHEVKEIDFTATATIPGKYTGPASRAYLYYTAEQKHWIEPLEIEISR